MNRLIAIAVMAVILGGCAREPGEQALKRGMRSLEKGRYAESISWFQRGLADVSSGSQRSLTLNCMGIAYHKLGQKENARHSFEESAAANPVAVEPHYNLGMVFFESGETDKALASFEKACLLSVPSGGGAVNAAPDTRALEMMAAIYTGRQQWNDARQALNRAPGHAKSQPKITTSLALVELGAGNTNRAMELLHQALEQDAHYAPAIFNLAMINGRLLDNKEEALPLLAAYTALAPSGPQAGEARALIMEIKNPSEKAAAAPRPAAPPSPGPAPAPSAVGHSAAAPRHAIYPSFEELMQVARKLEDQGRREAAFNNYLRIARAAEQQGNSAVKVQALNLAMALAGSNPQALYDLGVYFLERNRKEDALRYFKLAADQEIEPHSAAMALARISIEKQDYDTAIVSLKKADQTRPDEAEALWLLADLYDRSLFLTNAAAASYAGFAARFPLDRRAAEARTRLEKMNVPSVASAPAQPAGQRTFWQKMFNAPAASENSANNSGAAPTAKK